MIELSKPEKILLVANSLHHSGATPFHVATLTVEAWRIYQDAFGLYGYETKHPNANVVITAVVGKKGLAALGLLRNVGENLYEITALGQKHAQTIMDGRSQETKYLTLKGKPKKELFINKLLETNAHKLDLLDHRLEITSYDANKFFGNQSALELRSNLSTIVESDSPRAAVARSLRNLCDYLVTRFAKQLKNAS